MIRVYRWVGKGHSDYLMHPWEEREKLAMVEGGKNEVKCIIQGEGDVL